MIVAVLQMVSGATVSANLAEAERLIGDAVGRGARLIVLPENFALMALCESELVAVGELDGAGPLQDFLASQAQRHEIWLVGGSIPLLTVRGHKVRSACLVYDGDGNRVARYDKIHLFDAKVNDRRGVYAESNTFEAGSEAVVCDTPFGRLGLSICYDLRFPELYRRLGEMGAEIMIVPAAFTAVTGRAHWEVLLRARAIENLCYVLASAQGGHHANGRETHGDSMIVDPWGAIQARLSRQSGMVLGAIDRQAMEAHRRGLPCLRHRRLGLASSNTHTPSGASS